MSDDERCPTCDGPDKHASDAECIRSLADRLFNTRVYAERLEARLAAVEEDLGVPQP